MPLADVIEQAISSGRGETDLRPHAAAETAYEVALFTCTASGDDEQTDEQTLSFFSWCHQRASPVSSHRGKNPGVMSFSFDWMPVNMSNSVTLPGPSKARFGEDLCAYG